MTTIRDVAKLAQVSIAAASYALNDTGTISRATRQRVLQAAQELNYHPNAFARHLKNRKTCTIGVFITRFGGFFYEDILEGIHDAILKTDYELIVSPESGVERRILLQRQVDGAIVFDSRIESATLARLASDRFPIVVMDRDLAVNHIFPVLIDNAQGVGQAFQHLYNQGARKISFVAGAADSLDNQERMKAFLDEAARHDLPVPVHQGNFTELSGYNAAHAIIESRDLPEAVFCANDQMAIGFIRAMREHGLRAPQDIAIVGFDDIAIARYMQPSLTTIGAPRQEWGALAVTQLMAYLESGQPFRAGRLPTRLIERCSSLIAKPCAPA